MDCLVLLNLALVTQVPLQSRNDLELMHLDPAGDYVLMNDIVVGDWDPVGSESHSFTGTFDGQGFSLIGVTINQPQTDAIGFFGWTKNAFIRRVNVVDAEIAGFEGVGILVGYVDFGCTLRGCTVSGEVIGDHWVGGLAGFAKDSAIIDCHAVDVDVWSDFYKTGGLIGVTEGPPVSLVAGCSSTGHVGSVYSFCAGLVGLAEYAEIRQCFSTAEVGTLNAGAAGGLLGQIWHGSVADSYFGGVVIGDAQQLGGLSGGMTVSSIERSYSSGLVAEATAFDGALVGYIFGNSSFDASYWNTETSGQLTPCSPYFDCSGTQGLSDNQMQEQASFEGWDFERVWQIDSGYPSLRPICADDLDLDGLIGITDLLAVMASWGNPYTLGDFAGVLEHWGPCTPQ